MKCSYCGLHVATASKVTMTVSLIRNGRQHESVERVMHIPCALTAMTSGVVPDGWADALKIVDGFGSLGDARRPRLELVPGG